jgi:lysozyme family protein
MFQVYFDRLIEYEGRYVNDPNDPGGETNWGISKRAYPNFIIKDLTREDAYNIYKRDFWDVLQADNLPDSITFQLFDFAVNSGISTAIRYFQRALGVADDGHFGPVSKEAAIGTAEWVMIMNLNAERLDFMTRLYNWDYASKGWARRIAQNLRYGALDSVSERMK